MRRAHQSKAQKIFPSWPPWDCQSYSAGHLSCGDPYITIKCVILFCSLKSWPHKGSHGKDFFPLSIPCEMSFWAGMISNSIKIGSRACHFCIAKRVLFLYSMFSSESFLDTFQREYKSQAWFYWSGVLLVMFGGVSGSIHWRLSSCSSCFVAAVWEVIAAGHWKDGCRRSWWHIKGWVGEAGTRHDFYGSELWARKKKFHLLGSCGWYWHMLLYSFAISKTRSRASENMQGSSSWPRPDTAILSMQLQVQHRGAALLFLWITLSLIPHAANPLNRTLFRESTALQKTMAWLRFMSKPH